MGTTKIDKVSWFDKNFYKIEDENVNDVQYYPSVTTVLGVTSKPWLTKWYADLGYREANQRKEEAADAGSRIHHACQAIMEGGIAIYNPQYRPAYTADEIRGLKEKYDYRLHIFTKQEEWIKVYRFYQWVEVVKPIHVASEVIVYDSENQVAGSFDYLWYIEPGSYMVNGAKSVNLGGLMIFDLKTGKALDDDYHIQVAKYSSMFNNLADEGHLIYKDDMVEGLERLRVLNAGIIHVDAATRKGIEGVSTIVVGEYEIYDNTEYFNNYLLPVWKRNNRNMMPKVIDLPTMIKIGE